MFHIVTAIMKEQVVATQAVWGAIKIVKFFKKKKIQIFWKITISNIDGMLTVWQHCVFPSEDLLEVDYGLEGHRLRVGENGLWR